MSVEQVSSIVETPPWGETLKAILREQGRSQVWLARQLDMDSSQLRHILNGSSRYRVTTDLKKRIAEILGVSYQSVFNHEGGGNNG